MDLSKNTFGIANYYSLWSESIASTLSQFTGKEVGAEIAAEASENEDERLWVTFTVSDALLGEQAFSVRKSDALLLGQLFISEPVDPNAEFTPDHADAFTELFRQFAGSVAVQLTHILGKNCGIRFKDTQMPAWNSAESASLMVKTEPEAVIALQMDTGLFNSITKALIPSVPKAEPHAATAEPAKPFTMNDETAADAQASTIPDEMADQSGAPLTDKNLDLLLDVELEVSIRFGRRTMLLKDVLDLTSGAMVELDRRVRDPIELLLGGRVIARGEAVIVDGNYGIRITEIIPHSQRMAEIA